MSERVYGLPTELLPAPRERVLELTPELYALLAEGGSFRPRDEVENDESWRQIIPYAVLTYRGRLFLTERLGGGSEARLHRKLALGVGGHINPEDLPGVRSNARDVLEAALAREVAEEVSTGAFAAEAIGLIHSAADPVSRVHTGVLYLVRTAEPIEVRERTKLAGQLLPVEELPGLYERFEGWSRLSYDFLRDSGRLQVLATAVAP